MVYLKSADLVLGMGKEFVKEAMDISTKLSQSDGDYLFHRGDRASHFCILLKGKVKLRLGKNGRVIYVAEHPGEIIGWSSLIGLDVYLASAECVEPINLLRFDRDRFLTILEKNSDNAANLFNRQAENSELISKPSVIILFIKFNYFMNLPSTRPLNPPIC